MMFQVVNVSKQDKRADIIFWERKNVNLLKFIFGSAQSMVLHVYQRQQRIGSECLKQTCQEWDNLTLSQIQGALHEQRMFCTRIDIEPFVPCQWKWIWILESYEILYFTSCAPSGSQMYWQTHIRNITCQYRYNICSHTILTATHCWGRLQWGNESVTILFWKENGQAWNGDTLLHPNWRHSDHKHLLVKLWNQGAPSVLQIM